MRPQDERYIDQLEQIKAKLNAENEALRKELAEIKGRSCEGCKYGDEDHHDISTYEHCQYFEPDQYCSLWEGKE